MTSSAVQLEAEEHSPAERMNIDVLLEVFKYLNGTELKNSALVCKK